MNRFATSVAVLTCIAAPCGAQPRATVPHKASPPPSSSPVKGEEGVGGAVTTWTVERQAAGRPYARMRRGKPVKRVVVFVVDRISWNELMQADMPNLRQRILPGAAIGLMNGGITGRPSEKTIWTTLVAGCPARDRRAAPCLLEYTLWKAGIPQIIAERGSPPCPKIASFPADARGRFENLTLMIWTERPAQLPLCDQCKRSFVSPRKGRELRALDEAIAREVETARPGTLLILLSASAPSPGSVPRAALCPIVLFGPRVRPGLLTSASTRRAGLVSSVDFAPTVLDWFGLEIPDCMVGHAVRVVPRAGALGLVARLDRQAALTYAQRFPLVKLDIAFQAAAFAFAAWVGLLGLFGAAKWTRLAMAGLLTCMTLPLGLMVAGLLQAPSPWQYAITALAAAALLARTALVIGPQRGVALATAWVVAVVIGDLLTGSRLMQMSVLGHDPIIGARFYGIGNEHMAIVLGAAAVGLGFWRQGSPKGQRAWWAIAIAWAALVLVIGAPQVGANLGGALTAAAMFPLVAWPSRGRIRLWHLAAGLVAVALAAAAVVRLDLLRQPQMQSHIGQAARLLKTHGLAAAWGMVAQRLAMSLRLFLYTPLNGLGFVICSAAVISIAAAPARARALRRHYPWAWSGLAAAGLGAVAATMFNDSGVVAGGAMMTYVLGGLLALPLAAKDGVRNGQDAGA